VRNGPPSFWRRLKFLHRAIHPRVRLRELKPLWEIADTNGAGHVAFYR
jgi:hypothetical protein